MPAEWTSKDIATIIISSAAAAISLTSMLISLIVYLRGKHRLLITVLDFGKVCGYTAKEDFHAFFKVSITNPSIYGSLSVRHRRYVKEQNRLQA